MKTQKQRGFTLIELLVVIAIIGVLSSVVLASLTSARNKAKDAAVKAAIREYVTLFALQYNDTGSYAALQTGGWIYTAADCSALGVTGPYAANAKGICANIIGNKSAAAGLFIGNPTDTVNLFSIMAPLPGKGKMYCSGSSGWSDTENPTGGFTSTGCYFNP